MALTAKKITQNFKELEDLNNEAFPKEERVSIERMIDYLKQVYQIFMASMMKIHLLDSL